MKKHIRKTIAALTLTAGLMLQPVSAAYATGDGLVEEAGEVITEETWSEDYSAADETCEVEYSDGMKNEMQWEEPVEGGDEVYSKQQAAADVCGYDEGYVTEDAGLPAELWTDIPQNTDSAADTVLFDGETITEDTAFEDTVAADEPGNADVQEAGSDETADENVITEDFLPVRDKLTGENGQNQLAAADEAAADHSAVIEEELSLEETAGIDGASDNSKELFGKLAEIEFYGGVLEEQKGDSAGEAVTSASADPDFAAFNYLSGINLELYCANVQELKKIASGDRESAVIEITDASLGKVEMTATAEELGVPILTVKDGKKVISDEAKRALTEKYSDRYDYSAQTLLNAFLADLPYDLYWFNKASGQGGMKLQRMGSYSATSKKITLKNARYVFSYTVSTEYARNGETYVVDQTDRHVLDTAVANAKAIVTKHASKGDRDKLDAYRLEICEMVKYQMPLETSYGNAWQLIWVFDDDPTTNVVCEGYTKAFSYLAQLSNFADTKVEIKIVSGYISPDKTASSRHMWNVVRMDDGLNYLVDLTGCDSAGDDRYFLKGATGSIAEGYTCGGRPYYYQASSVSAYGGGEELELSRCDYGSHRMVIIDELKPTCTAEGHTAGSKCEVCGFYTEDYEILPATGHTLELKPGKAATCMEDGMTDEWDCSVCGEVVVEPEVIEATGHTVKLKPGKAATCTEDGVTDEWDCKVCGEAVVKPVIIKAKGHEKDGGTVTIKPTVFEKGMRTYRCLVCNEVVEEEPIEKLTPTLTLSEYGTISMWNGEKRIVKAYGLAYGDSVASVTSSDTGIVKTSLTKTGGGGVITVWGRSKGGTATITVQLASGYHQSFKVKVNVKTARIRNVPTLKTLKSGRSFMLDPVLIPATSTQKITYTSYNESVATVSAGGLVTGKKAGTAKIAVQSGSQRRVVRVIVK